MDTDHNKTEGMSDGMKIAALVGTLGLTGLVAYWCRDGGPLGGTKKASGSIAFPYETPTYPIGSEAWYAWMAQHRAQGLSVGATGTTTAASMVYHGGTALPSAGQAAASTVLSVLTLGLSGGPHGHLAGSAIGILSAGSAVSYLGDAPVERADFTDSVTGIRTSNSWISRDAVAQDRTMTATSVFNGTTGAVVGTLSAGSSVSNKRSFFRADVTDAVTGIQTPDVWIAYDVVQWSGDTGGFVGGGGAGGPLISVEDVDEGAVQAAPEYASWHARWGDHFWERPEWRTQFGERFRRFDQGALQAAPEYNSWRQQYGERFWERPEWRAQYGDRFQHASSASADANAYHHGQAWAASQTAEAASRTALQSGSVMHHQAAATSHQYAAASHQAAAAALQASHPAAGKPPMPGHPDAGHPDAGHPSATLTAAADKFAPLIASHQAAAASHQAAAQEHTAAAKAPPGSTVAVQHATTAVSHAAMATQHAAAAHHGMELKR
jgi:hypothetical protein